MAVYSLGAVSNLNDDMTHYAEFVELRITNTTGAPLSPIVVNAYSSEGAPPTGGPSVLYFTTTFAIGSPNGVVRLNIFAGYQSYTIRVSSPAAAGFTNDISIFAQGKDAEGNLVDDQVFPFGDWRLVATV